MDTVLQKGLHKGTTEEDNHLPLPAGHPSFDAVRDTVDFPYCKSTKCFWALYSLLHTSQASELSEVPSIVFLMCWCFTTVTETTSRMA